MIDCHARIDREPGSLDRLLACMAGSGIDRAVLYPDHQSAAGAADVANLAAARDRYPDRFAIVPAVDPLSPAAVERVEEFGTRWRAAGIELRPSVDHRRWLNVPDVWPLWQKLQELGLAASFSVASQDYNQFSDIVTGFPGVRVVLDDLGAGPGTSLSQYVPILLEYARYPQVFVSVSRVFGISLQPHPHRDLWPVLAELYRTFGASRLVWGSAYPEVVQRCGYASEAQLLADLPFLAPGDLARMTEENAACLWF